MLFSSTTASLLPLVLLKLIFHVAQLVEIWPDPKTPYCPPGYWTVKVVYRRGNVELEAKDFHVKDGAVHCEFCKDVACFIMRHTPTPKTTEDDNDDEEESTTAPLKSTTVMSCRRLNELPPRKDIITYLDCLQQGNKTHWNLFIYVPKLVQKVDPVECLDPDFLQWAPDNQIYGLELGFPMETFKRDFILRNTKKLNNTRNILVDSSGYKKTKIDANSFVFDMPNLKYVVFHAKGLKRDRPFDPSEMDKCGKINSGEEFEMPNTYEDDEVCYIETFNSISDIRTPMMNEMCAHEALSPYTQRANGKSKASLEGNPYMYSLCLLMLVLALTLGAIAFFCYFNRDKAVLCRRKKRRVELEESSFEETEEQIMEPDHAALINQYYGLGQLQMMQQQQGMPRQGILASSGARNNAAFSQQQNVRFTQGNYAGKNY